MVAGMVQTSEHTAVHKTSSRLSCSESTISKMKECPQNVLKTNGLENPMMEFRPEPENIKKTSHLSLAMRIMD